MAMASPHEGNASTRASEVLAFNGARSDGREFPVEVGLSRLATHVSSQVVAGMRDVSLRNFGLRARSA